MVNELELKKIWDKLGEKFSDQRKQFTYEYFKKNMQSPENRKKFWTMYQNKIGLGDYKTYEDKLTTEDITSTTQQVGNQQPVKSPQIIDYKVKYPSTQDQTKPFNSHPCDENVYGWTYGCKNNKIGLMNKILFGDDYGKIYGDELLTKLRNIRYLASNETKITEEIYNDVLKLGEEQGNVNLQESIIKETVKNILNSQLNKK